MIIDSYVERNKIKLKEDISVAYYNAYFQRCKTMPNLKSFLEKLDKKEMTDEEMYNNIKKWHGLVDS